MKSGMRTHLRPNSKVKEISMREGGCPVAVALESDSHLFLRVESGVRAAASITVSGGHRHDIEVFVDDGAALQILCHVTADGKDVAITERCRVGENASVHWQNVTLGSGRIEHDLVSSLVGRNATCDVDWVFYAKDHEHQRLSARNIYESQGGGGEITVRGVAQDEAHVHCDGMIEIGEGGGGTDAFLTEDVLMLDPTAKIDAVPGLNIKTNDVRASHSATVSKVTSDDLFYFASRGIAGDEARRMYVVGFLGDLTQRIADAEMREEVVAGIGRKYGR